MRHASCPRSASLLFATLAGVLAWGALASCGDSPVEPRIQPPPRVDTVVKVDTLVDTVTVTDTLIVTDTLVVTDTVEVAPPPRVQIRSTRDSLVVPWDLWSVHLQALTFEDYGGDSLRIETEVSDPSLAWVQSHTRPRSLSDGRWNLHGFNVQLSLNNTGTVNVIIRAYVPGHEMGADTVMITKRPRGG